MTREDLKDKVREDLGLTKQEASEIVEGVIETIRQTLSNGEEIILSGFGKFAVREKKQRAGWKNSPGKSLRSRRNILSLWQTSKKRRER